MPKTPHFGRHSIFRGKDGGDRLQGVITRDGSKAFERERRRLARLYRDITGQAPTVVSDADVIEYLARGEADTRGYLEAHAGK
jgi:hypothetical protein